MSQSVLYRFMMSSGAALMLAVAAGCSADHSPRITAAAPAVVPDEKPGAEPISEIPDQQAASQAGQVPTSAPSADKSVLPLPPSAPPPPPPPPPPPLPTAVSSMPVAPAPLAYRMSANAPAPASQYQQPAQDRENYGHIDANPALRVAENPVSTFSIDVDTGAYANVRRILNEGRLPPADAVRVEELVNYFDYAYTAPEDRGTPFATHVEVAPTPWNDKTLLVRIGIQGWKPAAAAIPPSNLVFLVDVSGSMDEPDKLPLVKSALKLLARQMTARDRISLVVYAGNTGVVLQPTPGDQTATIEAALDRLEAGGSTNGAGGIRAAYQLAKQSFIKNGNNRVLLATDGDFNVGTVNFEQLLDLIRDERKSDIALTTLGVGSGNYNDRLMEQLADAGDGNYAYLDTLQEAEKVLVEQRAGTLMTIARDVKVQVEFNPAQVAEYRLIGYEDRLLKREDFNNDKVDAGDIGAGHRVTALYEIALRGSGGEKVDPLRYGELRTETAKGDELAFLRLRYKRPEDGVEAASRLIETPIRLRDVETAAAATPSFRLAAAVAAYGQLLRGGTYTGQFGYADAIALAHSAGVERSFAEAGEFTRLAQLASALGNKQAVASGPQIRE